MLLEIHDGTVSRGGQTVLRHFDFEIRGTEKIAIVGRNGAGKTTLLEVLAGMRELDTDEKSPESGMHRARRFSCDILQQNAVHNPEQTVLENLHSVLTRGKTTEEYFSEAQYDAELRFDRAFTELGFEKEDRNRKLSEFSGGEQTRIMLICLLLEEPDVLLLDEPTNHLDLETTEWLEEQLQHYPKAVVLVSHDRYFIDRTADVVWEISGGRLTKYSGNYTSYREQKARRYQKQWKEWEAQQQEIRRLDSLIEKFRHKPRKASFARSRKKMLERMKPVAKPDPDDAVIHAGEILPARRGTKNVLICEHMVIGYTEPLREISLRITRGQKIGVFGRNGTGKSTFLKTAAGQIPPLKGKRKTGETIDIAYFDQMTAAIDSEKNVLEWYHDHFPVMTEADIRKVLAGFLFKSRDLGKAVKKLSGGEKSRLVLASLLQSRPNFLILDEPTNNMDIPARETLESIFRDYKGTLLFVSHDRYFLSHVADSILFFEPGKNAPVQYYPFGYEHYERQKHLSARGMDPAALRTAEEQKLIDGIRSVPKREHMQSRELSTEDAFLDWQFHLNEEPRRADELAFAEAQAKAEAYPVSEEEYENWNAISHQRMEKAEEKRALWTRDCLDWYEIWLLRDI